MHSDADSGIRAENRAQGLRTKRNNLLAALLSGVTLVAIAIKTAVPSTTGFLLGLFVGLVYANGFEYVLHRFVLHRGRGIFCEQHMVHHATLGTPEAARYVNFSRNPWGVVAVFFLNAAPYLIFLWKFRSAWVAGVFASFAIYYILFEEIHWRTHMGGWLPAWLAPAARHHLQHHADDTGRFNVFLPMFDWVVERFSSGGAPHRIRRELH
jgi:fatty acid hydroxylase family protein